MTNIHKLIAPACAVAAFPIFDVEGKRRIALNDSATNLEYSDANFSQTMRLDDRIVSLLPDGKPYMADMFRALEWLYAACAESDPVVTAKAAEYIGKPMPPLASIPSDVAHLLRRVYQTCELIRLMGNRGEPQFAQCGLEPLYRKLVFEANNTFSDLGARFSSSIYIGANTSCLTSVENIEASFRHSFSTALSLAKDLRIRIEIQGDLSGLRSLFTFYSDPKSVDFESLRGIPKPGEGDLSCAILYELIRICGGELRYANTNGVGELLLSLDPTILLDDNIYSFNEFTPLDESTASSSCLEYADIYNERRPRA